MYAAREGAVSYAAVDMDTLGSTFGRPDPPITLIDGSVPAMKMLLV